MHILIKLLADGLLLPIVLLAGYVLLLRVPKKQRYDFYTKVIMAGLTSYTMAKFVAAVWQPASNRPFEQLGVQAGASYLNNPGFPSDHVLFAGFLTIAVWYASKSKKLTYAMVGMTALMAFGRVLAQVHTPLDVMGGAVFALLGLFWYVLGNGHAKKYSHTSIDK
ncbi:MAG: phosphatase PAP2 family protein [Candidatus Saccharimonas sp.]